MSNFPYQLAFKYYWDSKTIYSAHSPFIYRFMKDIMGGRVDYNSVKDIELKRKQLLHSSDSISFQEFGAGSSVGKNENVRSVADIAKHSLSGKWQCEVLYKLIKQFDLNTILEIGTSLGLSTAYLAKSNPEGRVVTLEGNPSSVKIAKQLWLDLRLDNIHVEVGEFGSTLQSAVKGFDSIDFAFLDGNHRKAATIEYFHLLKSKSGQKSVFVIDDIYWSRGMNEAWNEIIGDESVAFSIDMFRMGIVFFDHSVMPKQHFKLIPYWLKPWAIGIFG